MKKLFNEEQQLFIINNYLNMTYQDIANQLGDYTATQISGWLHNNGYYKGASSIFNEEEKEYIRSNYLLMTYKEIGKHLGYSERQIRGWVNNNCKKKNRVFNTRYFQDIDNSTKAYWLGFIFADGWISGNELGIQLQKRDEEHLNKFNNELGGVHKISHSHFEGVIHNNKVISVTDSSTLRVYSSDMVCDLINHGINYHKTYVESFPIVSEEFFLDFLRGYIDGDGCIYLSKNNKQLAVHITSANQNVLLYIKEKLKEEYFINTNVYSETELKHRIMATGKMALNLLDLLYENENGERLERKYQKYLEVKGSPKWQHLGNNVGKIGEGCDANTEVNDEIA